MLDRTSAFFHPARTTMRTTAGPVELPILYYEASSVLAFFSVDRGRADAELRGTGLVPALGTRRRALAGLAFYDYRETSVGPYHEVGLALAVLPARGPRPLLPALDLARPPAHRSLGFHILSLPVSTEVARAAGRELWGYPKFVTELPFALEAGRFDGAVSDPAGGPPIARFAGTFGRGLPAPPVGLLLYSHLGLRDLRAEVIARGAMRLHRGGRLRLDVGPSTHPMAATLRALGLQGARPLALLETHAFQSQLHGPADIALRSPSERDAAEVASGHPPAPRA